MPDAAPSSPYRGRFAPSPTGPLHLGSLFAALGSWLVARQAGGAWIVRIEDVDRTREVPGAAEVQLRTLAAFGLQSDEAVVRQSARGDLYADALATLVARGDAFECHCSRSDLAGRPHRACVANARRDDPAIRVRVPDGTVVTCDDRLQGRVTQALDVEVGDFVLKRADGCWAYQLAVVVDDAAQGITDVVRGADLLDSTPRQRWLQSRLGLPHPATLHLPLLLDADGRKLSKSLAASPVDAADPLPALQCAWRLLGQPPAAVAAARSVPAWLAAATDAFAAHRIPRVVAVDFAAAHNGPATSAS